MKKKINIKNNSSSKLVKKGKMLKFNAKEKIYKSPSASASIKFDNKENINMEEYLKPNLDDMEFDDAIKYDKREFCVYFIAQLKVRHILTNTFYKKENLKPKSIKIIFLLLNIDLYFVVNGLFFSEEYLSELFNSTEKETFFSFFPRSISRFFYAIIVSYIVGIIINCIFIEEEKIKRIFLREKDDPIQLRYEIAKNSNSIRNTYIVFIFLSNFITIISWYYISCFNNTYPGVKEEWIKSSITLVILMQLFSILKILFETILRSWSFTFKSEKLYKIMKFIY